jgi:hypothetical protein
MKGSFLQLYLFYSNVLLSQSLCTCHHSGCQVSCHVMLSSQCPVLSQYDSTLSHWLPSLFSLSRTLVISLTFNSNVVPQVNLHHGLCSWTCHGILRLLLLYLGCCNYHRQLLQEFEDTDFGNVSNLWFSKTFISKLHMAKSLREVIDDVSTKLNLKWTPPR